MAFITVKNAQEAARHVYSNDDFRNFTMIGGFFDPKNDTLMGWNDASPAGGASGAVYRYNGAQNQYIVAFRGSSPKDKKDWVVDDLQIGFRVRADRANDAINYGHQVKAQYAGATIVVVGHSLGGYLAQVVGATCGLPFISFNAPPAGYMFKGGVTKTYKNGVNLRVNWDPVSRAPGKHVGPLITLPHYGRDIHKAHGNDALELSMSRYEHRDMAAVGFVRVKNI